jgi:3-hydroxybutyryl-CoA dehydratase
MKSIKILITEDLVQKFAEISGDKNLIHINDSFAAKTPIKKRIAHGLIILAGISRILTEELGDGNIMMSETVRYLKPAYIGDLIKINIEKNKKDWRGVSEILVTATNQKNEKILECDALCKNIYQHGK